MDSGLRGKVVLVTGGAGGIGSALVKQFVAEGAKVAIHYHSSEAAAKELQKSLGPQNTCLVKADLTKEKDVQELFKSAQSSFGPLEVLVANAGIWEERDTPLWEMELSQWEHTLATNLTSIFLCVREFFRGVKANKLVDPAVVLIGSTAGSFGEAGHCDYATSKAGATYGFLLTAKNELARLAPLGRINAINPSWVLTPMVKNFAENHAAVTKVLQTVPLRKVGRPEDVANTAVFLASRRLAGHVTGQTITLAGGMEGRVLYSPSEIDLSRA